MFISLNIYEDWITGIDPSQQVFYGVCLLPRSPPWDLTALRMPNAYLWIKGAAGKIGFVPSEKHYCGVSLLRDRGAWGPSWKAEPWFAERAEKWLFSLRPRPLSAAVDGDAQDRPQLPPELFGGKVVYEGVQAAVDAAEREGQLVGRVQGVVVEQPPHGVGQQQHVVGAVKQTMNMDSTEKARRKAFPFWSLLLVRTSLWMMLT